MRITALVLSLLLGASAVSAQSPPPPLPEEALPSVGRLPADYPASWVLVHDFRFLSILDGRVAVVDTADGVRPLKGLVRAAQFASMQYSRGRREIFTAETFYSRLTRGERTDAITIWDTATLEPKGEIVLPGGKRQQTVSYVGQFQLINGDRWALVTNFTPAQSVTVVDLDARRVLGEVDLPGCAHVFATGPRGFSSFCADGSMISVQLDDKGAVVSSATLARVQDLDNQPLFGNPAMVGRTAWFVSYKGQLKGFDLSGPVARPLTPASVGTAPGGAPEWRPGGWQVMASDAAGLLYVLMSPAGREGSHKDGGTEVWVVDPVRNQQLRRIDLKGVAGSITVTREATPHLVVARADGQIDLFDAASGQLVRQLGATAAMSPLIMVPAQ
ncbi:amine dehydrogenase large subunit [Sandarakinorhabdus rubra]|uniref:amine dehydrogenase large subunit n=1 Tax=Sandarakinorhabdus rubra TaxID=2672568 RepID=UPI0013DD26CB|nr:amine dehydrogenase large subunit [Sandarakinorhabdus rubra]